MTLQTPRGSVELNRPWIMGVVNASPESFSDSSVEANASLHTRAEAALEMCAQGADVLDIGGQSARTDQIELPIDMELERVIPLIEAIRPHTTALISVDTYRAPVAKAAIQAGADIVNDVSGAMDIALVKACAEANAALVVMHTKLAPKVRLQQFDMYDDLAGSVTGDVVRFLAERTAMLQANGVGSNQVIVDPGPDFAKTPAQTVHVLQHLAAVAALGHPVLLALSRKDFVGAATLRSPRQRLAGTLAAIGFCLQHVKSPILRVHDVAAVSDYLAMLNVLNGELVLPWHEPLSDALRYEQPPSATTVSRNYFPR